MNFYNLHYFDFQLELKDSQPTVERETSVKRLSRTEEMYGAHFKE